MCQRDDFGENRTWQWMVGWWVGNNKNKRITFVWRWCSAGPAAAFTYKQQGGIVEVRNSHGGLRFAQKKKKKKKVSGKAA